MSREQRANFAVFFVALFGSIFMVVWSFDLGNPLPVIIELVLVAALVFFARRARDARRASRSKPK